MLPDGYPYFRLQDPNGFQHLLAKDLYAGYGLAVGRQVICLVSKINCSGQIFIEPEHPHYKPGCTYPFEVKRIEFVGGTDPEHATAALSDVFGNELYLPYGSFVIKPARGERVDCMVEKIKKGVPVVCPLAYTEGYKTLEEGRSYDFRVVTVMTFGRRDDYYILKRGKCRYRIRQKYFRSYGFGAGDTIKCTFRRSGGLPYLEPEHPLYTPGNEYDFEVLEITRMNLYPEGEKDMIRLKNPAGKDINAAIPEGMDVSGSRYVRCIVASIKFGVPSVEICYQENFGSKYSHY